MAREKMTLRPRADKKKAKKRPAKTRRKRKPGLLKQPKRKPERQRLNVAASVGGLPRLVSREKRDRQRSRSKRMPQSVAARKRRSTWKPVTSATGIVRKIASSTRLISGTLLLLTMYALFLIGTNPRFYMSRIDVDGASILQRDEVEFASGTRGQHIFAIEPAVAAEAVGSLPGVVAAQVDLQWPDSLNITIEEDTPVLNWRENGRNYWVNTDGVIIPAFGQDMNLLTIEAVVPPPPPLLPTEPETDAEGNPILVEPQVATYLDFVPSELIETAQWLKQELPEISQLTFTPSDGLQFTSPEGWVAKFGTGGDLLVKMTVYEAIADNLRSRGIVAEYINVVHPDKPVFRPISGYTPPPQPEGEGL